MAIWLLKPMDDVNRGPWRYDCNYGYVIRAGSEEEARKIAQRNGENETWRGFEQIDTWLNPEMTMCTRINEVGESGVILVDYLRG